METSWCWHSHWECKCSALSLLAPLHTSTQQLQTTSCPLSPSGTQSWTKKCDTNDKWCQFLSKIILDKWGGGRWEGINFTKSGPIIHVLYYCVRWNEGAGWGAGTLCWRVMVMAPRSLVLDGVRGWSWPAFSRTPVLFERIYRQIRTLGIRETFSQKLRNQAWSFKGNNRARVPNEKFQAFQ